MGDWPLKVANCVAPLEAGAGAGMVSAFWSSVRVGMKVPLVSGLGNEPAAALSKSRVTSLTGV